jgi:hypothetical protein
MRVLRAGFWVLLVMVTIVFVVPRIGEWHVVSGIESLRPAWLALAGAILAVHYGLVFGLWTLLLRALGCELRAGATFRAFCLSLLPKYVPGKVVSAGLRARLATEAGAPLLTVSTSLVLEMGLGIGSAGVMALLGLALGIPPSLARAARWLAIVLGLGAFAFIGVFAAPLPASRWKQRIEPHLTPATALRLAALLVLYTAGWGISALSHWALARAIGPLPFAAVVPLGTALAISWGVGALSLFAPAGLGVKDGALYLSVRGLLGDRNALLFAALSRLLSVTVEAAITAAYWISTWARRTLPITNPRQPSRPARQGPPRAS